MVRYTIALCSKDSDLNRKITIQEQQVDILHREHFSEDFLCNINPAGQVPALLTPESKSIPDSVEITKYLAGFYPSMIPASHKTEIEELLSRLHGISFFSITFAGHPEGQESNKQYLEDRLSEDLTDAYRQAIEGRIRIIDEHLDDLSPDRSKKNEQYVKELMNELVERLSASKTGWFLGLEEPSAFDAHLIVFIARMLDRKRSDLIPEKLRSYASEPLKGKAWNEVMQGKSTLPLKI